MRYYLAPMEGITGYVYRNAYHAHFRPMDKYFTPFIAPKHNSGFTSRERNDILPENNQRVNLVPQILTNRSDDFLRVAEELKDYGYREINLNLGCPSGTVVSKGKGAGFLARREELDRFLEEISRGMEQLDMKLSVKTRLGKEKPEEFGELLSIYNKYPIAELIIHPRVQMDYYNNTPRMEQFDIGIKESCSDVCYNGDLFDNEALKRLTERYPQLKTVMLGRGVLADPFLTEKTEAEQIKEEKQDNADGAEKSGFREDKEIRRRLAAFHRDILEGYCRAMSGDRNVLVKMKELWVYMIRMFEDGEAYMKKIRKAQRLSEYEAAAGGIIRELKLK